MGGNVEFRADLARYKRQDKADINEARETCSVNPEVSLRNLLINGNILLTWHYPTSYIKTEPNLDTTKYVGVRRQFVEGWANCM